MQLYYKLKKFPFVRLTIPFIIGILTGYFSPTLPFFALFITTIALLFSIILTRLIPSETMKGIIISVAFILCGFVVIQKEFNTTFTDTNKELNISGQIISYPIKKTKYTKFIVKTDRPKHLSLRVLVYIFKEDSLSLTRGDYIALKTKLRSIENKKNQSFDYKGYMKRQYVNHMAFVKDGNYEVINIKGFSFIKLCSKIRNKTIKILEASGIREPELGLLKAMLLGVKDSLDTDLKNSYIEAGGIHFLAISGLHMGIVFILITFFLHNICRLSKSGLYFSLLSMCMIWAYAIITGLPSSVLRATIILSLIITGKYIKREVNLYNTIASSAFIILLFDPASLFSPGFQLSYAAYTSIIYLYPKLYKLIVCKNKVLNGIWRLSVVSIAAQIGTIPLCLLYFNHIYYYSFFTNICISCFIPVIIYGGFISIFISLFISDVTIISKPLSLIIKTVNQIIDTIASTPGAISKEINFSVVETLLVYAIIISCFTMIWYKKRKLIFVLLISIFLLCSHNSYVEISKTVQKYQKQ